MGNSLKWIAGVIILLSIVGTGIIVFNYIKQSETAFEPKLPVTIEIASAQPVSKIDEVHSADGTVNLITDKVVQSTGNTIYTFSTADIPETQKTQIYKTALPAGSSFTVAPNAWSPNNKLVFIKEATGSTSSYLVFNGNGDKFGDAQFIDVGKIFSSKDNGFNLDQVTGWDSDTLLHIDATNDAGGRAHFWFEVPSGAVIRLAR